MFEKYLAAVKLIKCIVIGDKSIFTLQMSLESRGFLFIFNLYGYLCSTLRNLLPHW